MSLTSAFIYAAVIAIPPIVIGALFGMIYAVPACSVSGIVAIVKSKVDCGY